MNYQQVLDRFDAGPDGMAHCPAHEDSTKSLSISEGDDRRTLVHCFAGCTPEQVVAAKGLSLADLFEQKNVKPSKKPLTVEALAKLKGFEPEFLKSLGVEQCADSVRITHRMMDGSPAPRHQFRHGGMKRFTWSKGPGEITPYGLDRLEAAQTQGYVLLVEGASDVWTGWYHHIPTLGLAGADMAKTLRAEYLVGIKKVYVLHETDQGGQTFVSGITARLQAIGYTGDAFEVQMPEGLKDLNDLHRAKTSQHFHDLFQAAIDTASPLAPPVEITQPKPSDKEYHLTAFGNRNRLVDGFHRDILYAPGIGWLEWDGKRWARDPEEHRLQLRAEAVVKVLHAEADALMAAAQSKEEVLEAQERKRWALACEKSAAVNEMVKLAAANVEASPETLDAHRMLFNVQSGTIELDAHHFREHRREDRLTHISPVTFDAAAECPTWMKFLDDIMCGRQELVAYLQRLVGYCLTGEVTEQCFFIWYGAGANGKSTLLEIIRALMGHDFAKQTPATTFLMKKDTGGGPSPEIARLKGCRLVTAVETDKGRRLSEALVKSATGGDRQVGRYLYQDLIEYDPTYKIIIAANHKPKVQGTDYAIWRRIQLLPFDATFKGSGDDRDMKKKLLAELPGILKWAIDGAMLWAEHGLNPPAAVLMATETYRKEEDRLREFLEDRCVLVEDARARAGDLFRAYQEWCAEVGEHPVTQKEFGADLKERGFTQARTHAGRGWLGIGLRDACRIVTRKAGTPKSGDGHNQDEGEAEPQVEVAVSRVTPVTSVTPEPFDTSFNAYTPARLLASMGASEDVTLDPLGEPVAAKPAPMSFTDPRKGHHTASNCQFQGCPGPHAPEPPKAVWTGGVNDVLGADEERI